MTRRRVPSASPTIAFTALLILGGVALRDVPAYAAESENDQAPVQVCRVVLDDGREVKEPGDDDQPTIIGRRRVFPHANTSTPATPPPNAGTPAQPAAKSAGPGPGWLIWVRAFYGHIVQILR